MRRDYRYCRCAAGQSRGGGEALQIRRTSQFRGEGGKVRKRRTAGARLQAETLLERPVFGAERPLSNARRIRGSHGRDVSIERRR
jgi:hypothetical protein